MKAFFERIREDYNHSYAYEVEPLFFKAFLWVLFTVQIIVKFIYVTLAAIFSPLWIVPYMIYCARKDKKE